jgi:hypothetical protein
MMKRFSLVLLLGLTSVLSHASSEILTYERFVHLSVAQKNQIIITTMEMMGEMENKYSPNNTTTLLNSPELKRLQSFFLANAYAAPLKSWKTYATEYTTLLKKPNNVQCVYAGWVSQVINGDCVQPSTLPKASAEFKVYKEAGGCEGTSQISCNPVVFGFKEQKAGSLFCVPAGKTNGNAHNSSLNCMKKALDSKEGDSKEARLKFLRDELSRPENKVVIEDVYKFLNQACLCPEVIPGLNTKYHEYMVPHRTCFGLMKMISDTIACEDPSKAVMDTSFFKDLQSFAVPPTVRNGAFDEYYKKFLENIRTSKASEIEALCKSLSGKPNDLLLGNGTGGKGSGKPGSDPTGGANSGTGAGKTPASTSPDGITVKTATPPIPLQPNGGTSPTGNSTPVVNPTLLTSTPPTTTFPNSSNPNSDQSDIVVVAAKCSAVCEVPKGKLGDAKTPMVCTPQAEARPNRVQLDQKLSVSQLENGKPTKWVDVRFRIPDPDSEDPKATTEITQPCKVTVVEKDVATTPTGAACVAQCTYPKGKKDDAATDMSCEVSGTNSDKSELEFSESTVSAKQSLPTIPAKYLDKDQKEIAISCPVTEKKEDEDPDANKKDDAKKDAKPTLSVKNTAALNTTAKYEAKVVGPDGKDGIPAGWTLVWSRKGDEGLKLTKPIDDPADSSDASDDDSDSDGPKSTFFGKDKPEKKAKPEADTGTPEIPAVPGTPEIPAKPATPAIPAQPATPAIPANPGSPAIPAKDGKPAIPAVPATPFIPAKPATPAIPAQPATPAVAATPGTPAVPAKPAVETKIPEDSFSKDNLDTEQPRASKDYQICASLLKGDDSVEACATVPKVKVTTGPMNNGQQPQMQTPPGALRAGGIE